MSILSDCDYYGWFEELSNKEKIELVETLLPDEKDRNEVAYWEMKLGNLKRAVSLH
jgi:hypothetical protein